MDKRFLATTSLFRLAGCMATSPRSGTTVTVSPQADRVTGESPRDQRTRELPERTKGGFRSHLVPECPMLMIPGSADVVPMPAVKVDSTRHYHIVIIPPGCTPRPA